MENISTKKELSIRKWAELVPKVFHCYYFNAGTYYVGILVFLFLCPELRCLSRDGRSKSIGLYKLNGIGPFRPPVPANLKLEV